MNLYLVRHGEAQAAEPDPALSARGVDDVRRLAAFLRDGAGARPAIVLHSSKRRARETAEILGAELGGPPLRQTAGLLPHDEPEDVADHAGIEPQDFLIVSHLPFLPRLLDRLLVGRETGIGIDLPPGGAAGLIRRTTEGGRSGGVLFTLRFLVAPDLL